MTYVFRKLADKMACLGISVNEGCKCEKQDRRFVFLGRLKLQVKPHKIVHGGE